MIVWPVNRSRIDDREQEHGADQSGHSSDAQRRQDDEDREDDQLEPEAAEAGAALGVEVVALVLDGRLVGHGRGMAPRSRAGNAGRQAGPGRTILNALGRRPVTASRQADGHVTTSAVDHRPSRAVVGLIEAVSDTVLDPVTSFPSRDRDDVPVLVIASALSGTAYRRIDALGATLAARNRELEARAASASALRRVSVAITALVELPEILEAMAKMRGP